MTIKIIKRILNLLLIIILIVIFILFKRRNTISIESIVAIFAALLAFISASIQIESGKNVSGAGYDLELQKTYTTSEGFTDLFLYCWNKYIGNEYVNNKVIYRKISKLPNYRVVLINYLTFFETVYLMKEKKQFDIKLLDDLFGRRFFVVVNCKEVQDLELVVNKKYYVHIYSLYSEWRKLRKKSANSIFDDKQGFCDLLQK